MRTPQLLLAPLPLSFHDCFFLKNGARDQERAQGATQRREKGGLPRALSRKRRKRKKELVYSKKNMAEKGRRKREKRERKEKEKREKRERRRLKIPTTATTRSTTPSTSTPNSGGTVRRPRTRSGDPRASTMSGRPSSRRSGSRCATAPATATSSTTATASPRARARATTTGAARRATKPGAGPAGATVPEFARPAPAARRTALPDRRLRPLRSA